MRDRRGVEGHRCKHEPLLVVVLAQNLVVAQVKLVADAEPEQPQKKTVVNGCVTKLFLLYEGMSLC